MGHLVLHKTYQYETTTTTWPGSSCEVRSNTSGCASYRRDFPKPVGRLTNTSFLSSTIFLIPALCCAFELGNRIVLLTTSNASSKVAILKALNSKMKQTIWLVRLLWRAEFLTYVTQMVIGWSGVKECCSNEGFWYFSRSRSREFQVNQRNPAKFTKTGEIPRNFLEILPNTCRHNIIWS